MRPGVRSEELEVVREALLQIEVQGIVFRMAVRDLGVDRAERRDDAGRPQRAGEQSIESGRRKSRECLHEEVVRGIGAEEVGRRSLYDTTSRPLRDEARQNHGESLP